MIVAKFEDLSRYESLNPLFKKAFEWIKKTDFSTLKPGKVEIVGSDLYASVQEYDTKFVSEAFFETHRAYTDIQFVVSGTEYIGWANKDSLTEVEPYNAETDFHKLSGPALQKVLMKPGIACILFGEDGHMPCLSVTEGKREHVFKICMKVKNA